MNLKAQVIVDQVLNELEQSEGAMTPEKRKAVEDLVRISVLTTVTVMNELKVVREDS